MTAVSSTSSQSYLSWGLTNAAPTGGATDYGDVLDKMALQLEEHKQQKAAAARAVQGDRTDAPVNTAFIAQQLAQESAKDAARAESASEDEAVASVSIEEDEEETSGAVRAFLEYMAQTPEERYLDSFLRSKGMTQADFDAMSPDDQQALLQEFKEFVKQKVAEKSAEELAKSQISGVL